MVPQIEYGHKRSCQRVQMGGGPESSADGENRAHPEKPEVYRFPCFWVWLFKIFQKIFFRKKCMEIEILHKHTEVYEFHALTRVGEIRLSNADA